MNIKDICITVLVVTIIVLMVQSTIHQNAVYNSLIYQVTDLKEQVGLDHDAIAQHQQDLGNLVAVLGEMRKADGALVQRANQSFYVERLHSEAVKELFGRKWDSWLADHAEELRDTLAAEQRAAAQKSGQ